MAKWSDQASGQLQNYATPADDSNGYFISRADLNATRAAIASAADRNIGGGNTRARVSTAKNYTVFEVGLDGNTIESIDCIKTSDVRLGPDDAWD